MYLILIGILTVIYLCLKVFKQQTYWTKRNVKQLYAVPILGDNWRLTLQKETFGDYLLRTDRSFPNERYYGVYQPSNPTLVIKDAELIKQIGVKDFDHFIDHRSINLSSETDEIWNKNLIALKGHDWKIMRATLSPSFTTSKMRAMFTLMKQSGEQYVDYFLKQNKELIELEGKDSFSRFSNDVIANCAFGISCDSLHEPENEFYLNAKEFSSFLGFSKMLKVLFINIFPTISKLIKLSFFSPRLAYYFKDLVCNAVKYREEHNIVRPDMINLLMEARKGQLKYEEDTQNSKSAGFATVEESHIGTTEIQRSRQMSDMDMAAQVAIFFLAGFDTISTVMNFMSYSLATNPKVQEKLRKEVDETFEATKGNMTYDTLAGMKYMDMVMSETLRQYPPLMVVDRQCNKPYVIPPVKDSESAVHLKEGDTIWFPIYALHYDPENYSEPEKFIPERFSDENKVNIKPYTYLPFGVGPRNCIGSRFALMEVKTLFYHILRNFEIVPVSKTCIPLVFEKGSFNHVVKGGCWVGFKKRLDV